MNTIRLLISLAVVLAWTSGREGRCAGDERVEYNRDVLPILAANCFTCHGPDSAARKADLRLDRRDAAVELGAIVPGQPDESEAIRRIFSDDEAVMMPPADSPKKLTIQQKEQLRRWVSAGANYQPHWSFIAPVRREVRKVEGAIHNPIDALIVARLQREGLTMAPEADRRTLARRLSLDLTGLPLPPEMAEAFVNDTSSNAYEQLVDRLLASPHWGEHRGRYWLDAARYADTHGFHYDNFREMWVYRDWIINAFNRNLPFDQFTIEQLAGDLLPDRSLNQQIASGFNRCNMTTNEGGVIADEYLVLYTRDRTETTSQIWLGLTANCAVCHDHKFDPLTQREFYELAAFFNNTTQAAMDGNIKDTPPVVFVPRQEDRRRFEALPAELAAVRRQLDERKQTGRGEFDQWAQQLAPGTFPSRAPSDALLLHASLSEGPEKPMDMIVADQVRSFSSPGLTWDSGHVAAQALRVTPAVTVELPEAGDLERDQPFSCAIWVKFTQPQTTGAILARVDEANHDRGWDLWVQGNRIGMHLSHNWPDNALLVVATGPLKPNEWHHVLVTYDGSSKAEGLKIYYDGQLQPAETQQNKLTDKTRTQTPLKLAQRSQQSRINGVVLQDLRIYGRSLGAEDAFNLGPGSRIEALAAKPAAERSDAEKKELFNWWIDKIDPTSASLRAKIAALTQEESAMRARGSIGHVLQERGEEAMAYILHRGEYDKRRDPVKPDTPDILPPMPSDLPRNRLGFAQWLMRPDHPLTARVTVNRFWQEVFGTGLVRTSGDFGVSGEMPVNQELLDWLSVEFRESGWDVKRLFKLMVTSAAYRQSAITTPEKLEKDPQNRLLSRGPRFRMDAEMLRDYALAASTLLVPKLGGPSVKPYQPEGVWEAVAMTSSNTRDYVQDHGENLYRRSLYTFWKRAAPPASLEIFNAPSREVCTVRRERTNTPLQAMATLNDPQFVEAARNLAQAVLLTEADTDPRLRRLGQRLVSRPWRDDELTVIKKSLHNLSSHYALHGDEAKALTAVGESKANANIDPTELAAWTMLTNELMNLDEVLNK